MAGEVISVGSNYASQSQLVPAVYATATEFGMDTRWLYIS
jgi:hypothetical protein